MKNEAYSEKNKKAKKRMSPVSRAVLSLILTLLIGVLLISGLKLLSIHMNYKKAENSYDDVVQQITTTHSDKDYPDVDFAKMKKINPEAVGFIYCKDLLRYPIVQGEDNDKYLDRKSVV